jgi:GGDEF domain-containing protein
MFYLFLATALGSVIASLGGLIVTFSTESFQSTALFATTLILSLSLTIALSIQIFQAKSSERRDKSRSTFEAALAIEHFGGSPYKDPISGLIDSEIFGIFLQNRCANAKRTLKPLSLILMRVTSAQKLNEQDTAYQLSILGEVLSSTLRDSDIAFKRGHCDVALILEDTSEAGALWACERINSILLNSNLKDVIIISAGVGNYPSHSLDEVGLISSTEKALEEALNSTTESIVVAHSVPES